MTSLLASEEVAPLRRMLIAEDHEVSRHLLKTYLQKWGFEVQTAGTGTEALGILNGPNPPPLAVLDWMMPELDGIEVCRQVRAVENAPYTYIVMLTSRSAKEEIAAGLSAGADDYLTKPCDRDELRARLAVGQRVLELERALAGRVTELETALAEVKRLKTLLPICMFCKRVRDDGDYWRQIEEYIHVETGTDFSHGICPDCMANPPGFNLSQTPEDSR